MSTLDVEADRLQGGTSAHAAGVRSRSYGRRGTGVLASALERAEAEACRASRVLLVELLALLTQNFTDAVCRQLGHPVGRPGQGPTSLPQAIIARSLSVGRSSSLVRTLLGRQECTPRRFFASHRY